MRLELPFKKPSQARCGDIYIYLLSQHWEAEASGMFIPSLYSELETTLSYIRRPRVNEKNEFQLGRHSYTVRRLA